MRNRSRILLLLLVVGIAGWLAWSVETREPVYNGKRLSEWLTLADPGPGQNLRSAHFLDSGATLAEREKAREAVRHIGTNAIPTLLRMLKRQDSPWALKLIQLAEKQSIIKIRHGIGSVSARFFYYELAWHAQWRAEIGFGILGADASNAAPALIRIFQRNITAASRMHAAAALSSLGPAARSAVPMLLEEATNSDFTTSLISIQALGGIHAEPQTVLPFLKAMLADTNQDINLRLAATVSVQNYGAEAKTLSPDLVSVLKQIQQNESPTANRDQLVDAIERALDNIKVSGPKP